MTDPNRVQEMGPGRHCPCSWIRLKNPAVMGGTSGCQELQDEQERSAEGSGVRRCLKYMNDICIQVHAYQQWSFAIQHPIVYRYYISKVDQILVRLTFAIQRHPLRWVRTRTCLGPGAAFALWSRPGYARVSHVHLA